MLTGFFMQIIGTLIGGTSSGISPIITTEPACSAL